MSLLRMDSHEARHARQKSREWRLRKSLVRRFNVSVARSKELAKEAISGRQKWLPRADT